MKINHKHSTTHSELDDIHSTILTEMNTIERNHAPGLHFSPIHVLLLWPVVLSWSPYSIPFLFRNLCLLWLSCQEVREEVTMYACATNGSSPGLNTEVRLKTTYGALKTNWEIKYCDKARAPLLLSCLSSQHVCLSEPSQVLFSTTIKV